MIRMKKEDIKKTVRKRYAGAAKSGASCCSPSLSCCGETGVDNRNISRQVGYSPEDLAKVPEESNLGLGCGNPTAVAGLKEGEIVLDLGAGAGIDCFLASSKVGPSGRIIGVDMTPEMVDRARENARQNGYANVEFRLGEIENLPAADNSVDVIISNCVINLSPEKDRVFREAYRVLKPGGRMLVSDIVLREPLPEAIRESAEVYTACVAGAMLREDYLREIRAAGFGNVEVVSERSFPADFVLEDAATLELIHKLNISRQELSEAIGSIISLNVKAVKAG